MHSEIFNAPRIIHDGFDQDSDDWLLCRMKKVTGSVFHKIATAKRGKALTQTAQTYMLSLISDWLSPHVVPEQLGGRAIAWGNENEPVGRAEFAMSIMTEIRETGFIELNALMGCSDDGVGIDKDGRKFLLELKCPATNHTKHMYMALENEGNPKKQIPNEYFWQCIWNSIICEVDYFYFVSFNPRVFTVDRLSVVMVEMSEVQKFVDQAKEAAVYFCEELVKKLSMIELPENYLGSEFKPKEITG